MRGWGTQQPGFTVVLGVFSYVGFISSGILLQQSAWEMTGKERSQSPADTGATSA